MAKDLTKESVPKCQVIVEECSSLLTKVIERLKEY